MFPYLPAAQVLAVLALCAAGAPARAGSIEDAARRLDKASIDTAAQQLRAKVQEAIRESGGDSERQQVHLALGLATGHFASDPLMAAAERAIAARLMADLLVAGDTVSVQAWEMRPWVHPQAAQGPVTLQSGSAAEKAKLQEMLPLTPQAGSQGGHDTEATITDITRSLGTDAGAVVVLLVPKAMSTSPAGQRVMGANHPDYLAALRSWRRVGQMNESGASDVLSFSVTPSPGRTTTRTLDSVIVAPTRFAGPSIPGGGTRTALLGNRAAAGQPATPARPETAPEQQPAADPRGVLILLGILLLAVLAAVAWFLLRPKPLVLSVAGQSFALADYKPGQEVCFLVGPGFAGGAGARAIRVENPSAPPDRLATFLREGRGVRVKNGLLKVQYHNNITAGAVVVLRQEGKHRLVLGGETHADPALPPETVTLEVDALLAPMRR